MGKARNIVMVFCLHDSLVPGDEAIDNRRFDTQQHRAAGRPFKLLQTKCNFIHIFNGFFGLLYRFHTVLRCSDRVSTAGKRGLHRQDVLIKTNTPF